jgi:tetratricopeptide (TPR) repeat protein
MGDKFKLEAIKQRDATSLFGFGKKARQEEAMELFTKAGNAYKFEKRWSDAGESYLLAAACALNTDSPNDCVNCYVEAGNAYKMVSPVDAVNAYNKAIEQYNASGRYSQSARYYKEVAEICEKDNNLAGAISNYQQVSDLVSYIYRILLLSASCIYMIFSTCLSPIMPLMVWVVSSERRPLQSCLFISCYGCCFISSLYNIFTYILIYTYIYIYILKAAEIMESDNKKSTATECWKKVAVLCSQMDDLRRASEIFTRIAIESLDSKLGAFSAKAYFMQAALCHLAANDVVAATNTVNTAKTRDFSFGASRECAFLEKLVQVELHYMIICIILYIYMIHIRIYTSYYVYLCLHCLPLYILTSYIYTPTYIYIYIYIYIHIYLYVCTGHGRVFLGRFRGGLCRLRPHIAPGPLEDEHAPQGM